MRGGSVSETTPLQEALPIETRYANHHTRLSPWSWEWFGIAWLPVWKVYGAIKPEPTR